MPQSPYTTIQNYKTWAGIADSSQDAKIAAAIPRASAMVQRFLGYDPSGGDFVDLLDGNGGRMIPVKNPPIKSVASVVLQDIGTVTIAPTAAISQVVGFFFDDKFVYLRGYTFCRGTQNVQITYTAGFATFPDDIEEATMMTVSSLVSAGSIDPNVTSETVPGAYTGMFKPDAGKLPAAAISILTPLRRVTW